MKTQRQRPLRCTTVAASLTLQLLHRDKAARGVAVGKAQKGWYSGLIPMISSDLKPPSFQNAFPRSPHYKVLKAVKNCTSIYFCQILQVRLSPLVWLKGVLKVWSIHTAQRKKPTKERCSEERLQKSRLSSPWLWIHSFHRNK